MKKFNTLKYISSLLALIFIMSACDPFSKHKPQKSNDNFEEMGRILKKNLDILAAKSAVLFDKLDDLKKICDENPAACEETDEDGNSLLMRALRFHKPNVALYLLEKSSLEDLKKSNHIGQNALAVAVQNTYELGVEAILKKYPQLVHEKTKLLANGDHSDFITKVDTNLLTNVKIKHLIVESVLNQNPVALSNEYFSVKKIQDNFEYEIAKNVTSPVFFNNVGTKLPGAFLDTKYVLLPQEQLAQPNNPFKNLPGIYTPRLSFSGLELRELKKENGSDLYENVGPLDALKITPLSDAAFNTSFADMENEKNKLGEGANGFVYEIKKDGMDFALKVSKKTTNEKEKDASREEYFNLEKLQFTKAVVTTYGFFEHDNKTYMLMEKGQKSLEEAIKANEKIDIHILEQAADSMLTLTKSLKELNIEHHDIKPRNFILTDHGIKAIDITNADTYGYSGSNGNLFARVLLEGYLAKKLFVTSTLLSDYFSRSKSYLADKIADEYMSYWYKFYCEENKLAHDCSNIKDFNDLYDLFNKKQRQQLADDFESQWPIDKRPLDFDYETDLSIPQLMTNEITDWQPYFEKKKELAEKFCMMFKHKTNLYDQTMINNYPCDDKGNPKFDFTEINDDFKAFVNFYFSAEAKEKVYKGFALKHDQNKVFRFIIETQVTDNEFKEKLLRLYDFK